MRDVTCGQNGTCANRHQGASSGLQGLFHEEGMGMAVGSFFRIPRTRLNEPLALGQSDAQRGASCHVGFARHGWADTVLFFSVSAQVPGQAGLIGIFGPQWKQR